jgi:hypothetical protein
MLDRLQSEFDNKEKKLNEQTAKMERWLTERDTVILRQANVLEKLQKDLAEVSLRAMEEARGEMETQLQRLLVGPIQS